ncbi:hypothetical protein AX15_000120 [Amanita polypyramis BW_CC]|nr:hypothetical protein AX15_000120 [Amanita polypyramis BW_CC]
MADVARNGTKRKISTLESDDDIGSIVRRKLHHGLKEAKKASKKARDFELRKTIKRLKLLRSKGTVASEINDLQAQLVVLKHLDPEIVGNTAFRTKVRKNKRLHSNNYMESALVEEIGSNTLAPAQAKTAAFKAQSKLLSSRTLADEITNAVQALESIINPREPVENDATLGQRSAPDNTEDESEVGDEVDDNASEGETGWESVTIDDSNEGWESGSVEEAAYNISGDDGAIFTSDKEEFTPKFAVSSGNAKSSGLQSTFLPSLSVGFVRGDPDDSDWNESEAKTADPEQKKNRRGQRARRAIWEKKYGRNANHKKKELEEWKRNTKPRQQEKTDNKRRDHSIHRVQFRKAGTIAKVRTDRKQDGASASHIDDRPLHPSWEAKKRLKEKMTASIIPSQGKKIVF